MSLSPIPQGVYPSVTDISPQALAEKGVRLVLADLEHPGGLQGDPASGGGCGLEGGPGGQRNPAFPAV